jgi:hypothetical protein
MHPETRIYSYWFRPTSIIHIPEPTTIIVDDDTIPLSDALSDTQSDAQSNARTCVFIQCEPRIVQDLVSYVSKNASQFHTIMTYDHDLLVRCPNTRFYIAAQTWISHEYYQKIDISLKEYKISTLAGSKCINQSAGHLFRQAIHYGQQELARFPLTFFRSSVQHPPLPDLGNNPFLVANTSTNSKEDLFHTFQFAIVIENTTQRNYFSEKLIDCLITKTIPIYYGGVNIHQFFNTTGWIILPTTSVEDLASHLETLHPHYYSSYQEIIEQNYEKAVAYSDFYRNLNQSISREEYMDRYGS